MTCPHCGSPNCRYRGFVHLDNRSEGIWSCQEGFIEILKALDPVNDLIVLIPDMMQGLTKVQAIEMDDWEYWMKIGLRVTEIYKKIKPNCPTTPTTEWPGPYDMGKKDGGE